MNNPQALVVDDEPDIRELLGITLERMNLDVAPADTIAGATISCARATSRCA